ncbi:MAG: TIGR02996 domain-containing protein [Kofleriaceae bacterium]
MDDEARLLAAIRSTPAEVMPRVIYADWLEDRGDRRAGYVRAQLALTAVPPDHPLRWDREAELSKHRRGLDRAWLDVFERTRERCDCMSRPRVWLHDDVQDTETDAWKQICDAIETAAARNETELDFRGARVITLPRSIGKVTSLRRLNLYGSQIQRMPRELGLLPELTKLEPYTSYGLHWYPYELARAPQLRSSTVSTRALYGNFKYRPPFPVLAPYATPSEPRPCSVCDAMFEDRGEHRYWISMRIASDVMPALVNACSADCIAALPAPAPEYFDRPHRGGKVAL